MTRDRCATKLGATLSLRANPNIGRRQSSRCLPQAPSQMIISLPAAPISVSPMIERLFEAIGAVATAHWRASGRLDKGSAERILSGSTDPLSFPLYRKRERPDMSEKPLLTAQIGACDGDDRRKSLTGGSGLKKNEYDQRQLICCVSAFNFMAIPVSCFTSNFSPSVVADLNRRPPQQN